MKINEIKQRSSDISRDLIRRESLVRTGTALELLPEVLESVSVDKRLILERIEDVLRKPTANPLNSILSIFGLRIIHTQITIDRIDDDFKDDEPDFRIADVEAGEISNFLMLNEASLAKAINAIAERLKVFEEDARETEDYLREQNAALQAQLEKKESMLGQLNLDCRAQLKTVAERVQYMLSFKNQEGTEAVTEQLIELLTDLDMKALWREDLQDLSSLDARFTCLKCSTLEKRREKPCILYGDQVLMKGVAFVKDENASE